MKPDTLMLRYRLLVLAIVLGLLIPYGGLPLWRHVYGLTGDLSPVTWLLGFVWFGFPVHFYVWVRHELPFKRRLMLALVVIVFYVLSLNSGPVDPYAYGYQPWALLAVLTCWVLWRGRTAPGLSLLLGIVLGVYAMHGLNSYNMWDYLFDPVLAIFLIVSLIRPLMSRRYPLGTFSR